MFVALALSLLGYAGLIEPYALVVTHHQVGLPPAQAARTVRVLQLTDVHVVSGTPAELGRRERRVLELAKELQPDLIVLTGDLVSSVAHQLTEAELETAEAFLDELLALAPPLGVYACRGNHEDFAGERGLQPYTRTRVPLLEGRGDSRTLAPGLVLHGAGDPAGSVPPASAGPAFDLLLCHYPGVLEEAAEQGHELVLTGHSHGGQVRLPGLSPWLPNHCGGRVEGWFEQGRTRLYVCRGVGTSIYPLRFNCRPELAVFELGLPPE